MSNLFSRWFQRINHLSGGERRQPKKVPARSRRTCLNVEQLESRLVPATYNVNTLADPTIGTPTTMVNNANGRIGATKTVSLRSAIEAANHTPGNNMIRLTLPGVYKIGLPGAGEDDNLTGDFDINPNAASASGSSLTIMNASVGKVIVDGNHLDRVFDINPKATAPAGFTVIFRSLTIRNGVASPGDGAAGSGGGIRDQGNVNLTLMNMVVTRNLATADGGGLVMFNAADGTWKLTISNSTISNNHAGDAGGGIDTDGKGSGGVFITNSQITGNTDLNQGAGVYIDVPAGAPPTANGADMTMTRTLVANNEALAVGQTSAGGGISNAGTGTMTIVSSTVIDNFSGGTGGGFDDENGHGSLVVRNSSFLANTAVGNGGGIHEAGPSTMIFNSTIGGNFSGGSGGGFSNDGTTGTVQVQNSLFIGNSADGNGGAIQDSGPSASISNTELKGNSTGGSGGGIFANGVTLTVTASTIAQNTAAANGGGLELQTTGTGASGSTITNATITGNSALNNAGSGATPTPFTGGGIDAPAGFTGSVSLLNDTINGNFADGGGGVFWAGTTGSTFSVQNTIIAQNFATTAGPDANNPSGSFTDNGGNLIGIAGTGSGNTGFNPATSQLGSVGTPLDPLLNELANNGGPTIGAPSTSITLETETLRRGSPAIGKGITTGAPLRDERGFLSVVNGKINVGAVSQATPE
jgi:hypothetical protein